ncbi:hypothetical protein LOTGIDRAFT_165001 [Lottia gigantea]|uniref:C-type lectin domain-containing protein n=1 Tax=Lottia gigantea TaxID=225164 RepID=V4A811_LOTGI|nr:hypothetical protein LOTGIDRAFT_165001 [Lottia gigantea]ESO89406.1 hypothetical protein LOTGIDRAFT_165001 [Lottia gigantea]
MMFCVFLVFFRIDLVVAVYTSYTGDTFVDALAICNNNGQDMLTISSWQEYTDSLTYSNQLEVSWLGVEETGTSGEYRWISNGKILTNLDWVPGQPEALPCTYVHIPDKVWYTDYCTETHNYICVKNSFDYVVGPDKVNYSTAIEHCSVEGGLLPVMITQQDKRDFYTAILEYNVNNPSLEKVWLGLVADGEYFKWVTGEDLTPPYKWATSGREQHVHYHHAGHKDEGYHSDNKPEKTFVCQPRVSDVPDAVTRSPNYFNRVVTNTLVLGDALYAEKDSNQIECAAVCALNPRCIRFIQFGSFCQHFDSVSHTNVKFPGFSYWEKRGLNETLF